METGVDARTEQPGVKFTGTTRQDFETQNSERPIGESQVEFKFDNQEARKGFKERFRRAATIEVSETCDLLCIPRKDYQSIFLNLIQRDLDQKLRVLVGLPFLSV